MAKRFPDIEASLLEVFTGLHVTDLKGGALLPVVAYMDMPDTEEVGKRVFPAIGIDLESMDFEVDMEHTNPPTFVAYDASTKTITERRASHWYRLCYRVHSYALYALHDRELMRLIENRLSPRDALVVGDESFWVFRQDFQSVDAIEGDRMVYHKVWTFEVLADIDNSETDTHDRVVEEIHLLSYNVKNQAKNGQLKPVNAQGVATTAQNAVRTLHREIRYDDTIFWFNS